MDFLLTDRKTQKSTTMKNLTELVNENNNEVIEESFQSVLYIGAEIAILTATLGMFIKSFKEIAKGVSIARGYCAFKRKAICD